MDTHTNQNHPDNERGLPVGVILFFSLGMILCLCLMTTALESNHTPSLFISLALFFLCAFMVFLSVSFLVHPLRISPPRVKLGFAILISLIWTLSAWFLLNRTIQRRPVFAQTFWENIALVCSGKGIPASTAYNEKVGIHTIVPQVRDSVFYGKFPLNWFPDSLLTMELVLCYDARQKKVETCQFLPAGSMKRIQYELDVRLISANSGKPIAARVFAGGMPDACPPNLLAKSGGEGDSTYGTPVNTNEVMNWLDGFVNKK